MDPLGRYAIAIEGEGYSQRYWVIDTQGSTTLTPCKEAALRRAMIQANASKEERDA
jgi:hypothetical protein